MPVIFNNMPTGIPSITMKKTMLAAREEFLKGNRYHAPYLFYCRNRGCLFKRVNYADSIAHDQGYIVNVYSAVPVYIGPLYLLFIKLC